MWASQIVDLQQKLHRAEEVYDLLPAQQKYIVELESTLAAMETNLNSKQREESNYHESYSSILNSNNELKMSNEVLQGDVDALEVEKALMKEEVSMLQQKSVNRMIFNWNRGLLNKVFGSWRKDAAETANYKRIVLRFKSKMLNACLWRYYKSWVQLISEKENERRILNKFRGRMLNMCVTRSFNSWCGFVSERTKLRKLVQKVACERASPTRSEATSIIAPEEPSFR